MLFLTQIILCAIFLTTGSMKLFLQGEAFGRFVPISKDIPRWRVRIIGVVELLAAAGIILPSLTAIFPFLTIVTAGGIIAMMVGAFVYHIRHEQWLFIFTNLLICLMAAYVIMGLIQHTS